jgi:L-ascorbate metabolism protein UlaG (beta-lactamase superfamily)
VARYSNADPNLRPHRAGEIVRWGVGDRLLRRRRPNPPGPPALVVAPDLDRVHNDLQSPWLLWIGHASFLLSLQGRRLLIDPVLSHHAGVVYRRHLPPALTIDQLPPIDAVLVTHNHYDHLDAATIRSLPADLRLVVPRGLGGWMRRRGRSRVDELDWWQDLQIGGVRVTLVPAVHWSRRGVFDTNRVLWGGYVVAGDGVAVYHSGDTAAGNCFAEISRRFRGLDAALLPVGSYEPAWFMERHHLNPEQACRAFLESGAQRFVPMHWGTFQLTDEPLCEPAERVRRWWSEANPDDSLSLELLPVGGLLDLAP